MKIIRPDSKPECVAKLIDEIGHDLSNWSGILNLSFEHNVLPLLYYSLYRSGLDEKIPEQARGILGTSMIRRCQGNKEVSLRNPFIDHLSLFMHRLSQCDQRPSATSHPFAVSKRVRFSPMIELRSTHRSGISALMHLGIVPIAYSLIMPGTTGRKLLLIYAAFRLKH